MWIYILKLFLSVNKMLDHPIGVWEVMESTSVGELDFFLCITHFLNLLLNISTLLCELVLRISKIIKLTWVYFLM